MYHSFTVPAFTGHLVRQKRVELSQIPQTGLLLLDYCCNCFDRGYAVMEACKYSLHFFDWVAAAVDDGNVFVAWHEESIFSQRIFDVVPGMQCQQFCFFRKQDLEGILQRDRQKIRQTGREFHLRPNGKPQSKNLPHSLKTSGWITQTQTQHQHTHFLWLAQKWKSSGLIKIHNHN